MQEVTKGLLEEITCEVKTMLVVIRLSFSPPGYLRRLHFPAFHAARAHVTRFGPMV